MSKITRKNIRDTLKEFDGQEHDWITVYCTSKQADGETHRLSVFNVLEDKKFVALKNEQNFSDGNGLPTDDQGRFITHEKTYRITALGRDFSRSFLSKAAQNVLGNIPTIVIAVGIGVVINLLSAYFQKEMSSQTETLPTLGSKEN